MSDLTPAAPPPENLVRDLCRLTAGYWEQIVATLSHQLMAEFGRGFERTNLTGMMKFAEALPDGKIVVTLSRKLSWSRFQELLAGSTVPAGV